MYFFMNGLIRLTLCSLFSCILYGSRIFNHTKYKRSDGLETKMKWKCYGLNFLAFFAISMVNTQMIPFLTSVGYDVVTRGMILAGNAVVAIVGQFFFGYICDKYKKIKPFFAIAYALLLASGIFMFWVSEQLFWYHFISVGVMGGMVKVIMGLNETWMLELDSEHYGTLRAAGAIGLTVGSPIAGFLVDTFGFGALIIGLGITSILCFLFIFLTKDVKKEGDSIQFATLKKLATNVPYVLLVLIYLLVYMIGTADQYVVIDKMLDIGSEHSLVGIKWALQSFMEVPLFLLAGKILKKYKPSTLLMFGTIMYGIKFVLYGLSPSGWWIVATAALQVVTLPIIMLTSKVLIKETTPQELASSAQMFAMAIFIGVSGLVTPLITSFLSDTLGYDTTLYLVAGFAIVPLLVIVVYLKVRKKTAS